VGVFCEKQRIAADLKPVILIVGWLGIGCCQMREKIDWQEPVNLIVGADDFYFLLPLANFQQANGEWAENQILIPNWTYFYCPDALPIYISTSPSLKTPIGEGFASNITTLNCST